MSTTSAAVGATLFVGQTQAASVPAVPVEPQLVAIATDLQASPAELKRDLSFSREEERMARDLYRLFADRYGQARPFSMITKSEQRHFDAVGVLLNRYGVQDPSAGRAAGSYAHPEIQRLYDGWKAQGSKSKAAAFQVGKDLEQRDIADLKRLIARHSQADVKQVLGHLLRGSQNHLRAYTRAASGQPMGPGNGRGPGGGNGMGQRMGHGMGHGMGQGMGQGNGPGMGRGMGQGRQAMRHGQGPGPTDCPMAG